MRPEELDGGIGDSGFTDTLAANDDDDDRTPIIGGG